MIPLLSAVVVLMLTVLPTFMKQGTDAFGQTA